MPRGMGHVQSMATGVLQEPFLFVFINPPPPPRTVGPSGLPPTAVGQLPTAARTP